MSEHYSADVYGFSWGGAIVERAFSDNKKGWVTIIVRPRTPGKRKVEKEIQVYVTKTGKIRVHSSKGEWKLR